MAGSRFGTDSKPADTLPMSFAFSLIPAFSRWEKEDGRLRWKERTRRLDERGRVAPLSQRERDGVRENGAKRKNRSRPASRADRNRFSLPSKPPTGSTGRSRWPAAFSLIPAFSR
jgi:hypothetical protein